MIDAVIFDFDGLILDTEVPVFRAWTELFRRVGVPPLSPDEWSVQIGTVGGLDPLGELAARAAAAGSPLETAAISHLNDHRRQRRDELVAAETVRPGVVGWLEAAARRGLVVAVASSSPRDWVQEHLGRIDLLDRFAVIVCHGDRGGVGLDLLAAKPAPDLYLEACRLLGVAPAAALAVEDSPNGVRAAKAAGLACVAVPNDLTRLLDLDHADLVIESLASMTLNEVLEALGRW
jgi:HAD superfamily hydrolase (TIGR01509 family)